jgi:hypothetical protein
MREDLVLQIISAAFEDEMEKMAGLPRYLSNINKGTALKGGARMATSVPEGAHKSVKDYAAARIQKQRLGQARAQTLAKGRMKVVNRKSWEDKPAQLAKKQVRTSGLDVEFDRPDIPGKFKRRQSHQFGTAQKSTATVGQRLGDLREKAGINRLSNPIEAGGLTPKKLQTAYQLRKTAK